MLMLALVSASCGRKDQAETSQSPSGKIVPDMRMRMSGTFLFHRQGLKLDFYIKYGMIYTSI